MSIEYERELMGIRQAGSIVAGSLLAMDGSVEAHFEHTVIVGRHGGFAVTA
jgi:methionine aminopeptidase